MIKNLEIFPNGKLDDRNIELIKLYKHLIRTKNGKNEVLITSCQGPCHAEWIEWKNEAELEKLCKQSKERRSI
jgi:hypothetical protein